MTYQVTVTVTIVGKLSKEKRLVTNLIQQGIEESLTRDNRSKEYVVVSTPKLNELTTE